MDRAEAIKVLEKQFDKSCGNYRYQNKEKLDFEDALWVALAALREHEQRQWVSVKERLPEDDHSVNKHIEGEKFGFLTVLAYNGVVKQTNRFFCNATQFGLPKTCGWEWASSNVTHWMPLPEPPKEGADHE